MKFKPETEFSLSETHGGFLLRCCRVNPLSRVKPKLLLAVLLAILPLAAPATGHAKAEESASAGPLGFSCVAWGDLPCPELFYRRGNEFLPIKLSPGQRSQAYPLLIGVRVLELYIKNEKGAGKLESSADFELAGLAPLPQGAKRMLFLIEAKKDANGLPLQLRGMDDSLEAFPAGSFRFINQTPNLLRAELGGTTHELPQGEMKVVTPDLPAGGGFLPVIIKNEEGRNVLESRFFAQRAERELVVIRPPAEGRMELSVKFLSDVVPSSSPPAEKAPSRK